MNQRELLQQCLKALEEQDYPWHEELIKGIRAELKKPETIDEQTAASVMGEWYGRKSSITKADIRAELEKPEPVECGTLEIRMGIPFNTWDFSKLKQGSKYKLFAVEESNNDH